MTRTAPLIALTLLITMPVVTSAQGLPTPIGTLPRSEPGQAANPHSQTEDSNAQTSRGATSGLQVAKAQSDKGDANAGKPDQKEFQDALDTGDLLARSGRYLEALRQFQHAATLRQDKCPVCYSKIAQSYVRIGAYDQAAVAAKRALDQKPDDPAALTNMLGVALYLQGGVQHLAEAVNAFHQAIELSKDSLSQPYFNMGIALMKLSRVDEGTAALKEYLKRAPDGPNSYEARIVMANPRLAGEQIAPDFKVKTTAGQQISVEGLRGKIVLLDFWASWCGPCREEMPAVKAVWQKYKNDRFIIIGVDMDEDRRPFDQYLKAEGITWPQYLDVENSNLVARLYGVDSIPQTVLIDQDGVIRATGLRGPELYEKIGELLKKLAAGPRNGPQPSGESRN
ncbi:MAG: redoxin domain-containing protein [Blastocatellia bacterium]